MLFYAAVGLVAVISIAFAFVYTYQEKIIGLFVNEANKHIKTKVEVGQIALSLFDKFPYVAVSLDQVNVLEGVPESTESLARADKLYLPLACWMCCAASTA